MMHPDAPYYVPEPPPPSPETQTDPIHSAAASLLAMGETAESLDPKRLSGIEQALRNQITRIERDDLGGMEIMLTCHTMMLHRLFSQSITKYAASSDEAQLRLHSAVAIKSQNSCRMTVNEIARMKAPRLRKLEQYRY